MPILSPLFSSMLHSSLCRISVANNFEKKTHTHKLTSSSVLVRKEIFKSKSTKRGFDKRRCQGTNICMNRTVKASNVCVCVLELFWDLSDNVPHFLAQVDAIQII